MSRKILELRDVSKVYHLGETQITALSHLNFSMNAGEFTALVGASGSGKSTLLHLVGCIDEPDEGEVIIDGIHTHNMSEMELSQLRNQKIGFIFQSFNLIPVLNVFENVELPLLVRSHLTSDQRAHKVLSALKDVGLDTHKNHPPDKLSGGQRQRVAIARALVTDPILVLADEPTANLDSKTTQSIMDLLFELNQRRQVTFLFCSHDEKLIQRVDRIVRIQDGQIRQL